MAVDAAQFRALLGRFATGVTVLTSRTRAGEPIGMTASAVASVSLDPPLVLVCVDRSADMHAALQGATHFGLNILAADQEPLSLRFADIDTGRFVGLPYRETSRGVPVLDGVLAHLECEKQRAVPAGDHTVFFGLVVSGEASERQPLVYFRGEYTGLDAHG